MLGLLCAGLVLWKGLWFAHQCFNATNGTSNGKDRIKKV